MDVETARRTITAEAPRRLRLDELLRELGASDGANAGPDDRDPAAGAGEAPRDGDAAVQREGTAAQGDPGGVTASAGDAMPGSTVRPAARPDALTVGALVDKADEGGFGFLIGILTLIAIPFVGLSTPFGLAIALLGGQLMLGRHHPWLPQRTRRRALSMAMLDRVLGILARRTRWLARLSRRRWEPVIQPRLIGLCVVLLALGLALPLPIPGSNLIFLIPLFVYAVGILERDGAWIAVGHACTVIDMTVLVVLGATVIAALERLWRWIA
ncbi:MAG TPA: exopolysaccharide biosynthesis protein [Kofleriaceae bacterium]|nr:exopolysaccharide biosynthesis protein [Kofleriaceae bacterium]